MAVAISWGDYFKSLISGWISMPDWLTTGYRTALLSSDPAVHGADRTPRRTSAGIPILINVPAFAIVMLITWLLLLGVRESARANNVMVAVKLIVLALFIVMGAQHINTANYHPFAPNGFTRHPPGRGDRLLRLHRLRRDFDGGRGDEESAAQPADRHPGRARDLHGDLHRSSARVLTGMVPYAGAGQGGRSAGVRAERDRPESIAKIVALGAVFSMAAVLLVFQYGQPRIFFAMARDGLLPRWAAKIHREDAHAARHDARSPGVFVALVGAHRRRRRDRTT